MTYDEFVMQAVLSTIGSYVDLYRENRALGRQRCIEDARILADDMFGVTTVKDETPLPRKSRLLKR
jgi:hypothetical protein